ncbi:hypothetical protein Nepgr_006059 [Nepenthes gracilis]|uniref:C2 domain-containing protein n=1 Tax=Nepenthes gracilis TaxID=150966 RepID=A0AAD3S4U6_NEPGR|nr:hypothetical protein Nepgr_006059 [Nepenthes gracilis]
MALSRPPPQQSKLLDLDLTIVSAKHLKNVNWRNGDLKPYAIFWIDPERRLATKSDDSGSTRPVWNERFVVPITLPLPDSFLSVEIFHSKPSDTPKPLVGTLRVPLKDLPDSDDSSKLRSFELSRPSGRPHGKIRLKLSIKVRPLPPPPVPDYHTAPPSSYYYSTAPPHLPPPTPTHSRDYVGYPPSPYTSSLQSGSQYLYSDPYLGYYSGYYSPPPPPTPPRPFFNRPLSYRGGPSAPVDYSSPYDQKPKGSKMGAVAAGGGVGLVTGAFGGLALEEGLNYEEEKIAERVDSDLASRDDYSEYHVD